MAIYILRFWIVQLTHVGFVLGCGCVGVMVGLEMDAALIDTMPQVSGVVFLGLLSFLLLYLTRWPKGAVVYLGLACVCLTASLCVSPDGALGASIVVMAGGVELELYMDKGLFGGRYQRMGVVVSTFLAKGLGVFAYGVAVSPTWFQWFFEPSLWDFSKVSLYLFG